MSTSVELGELQSTYDALVEAAMAQDTDGYVAQFVEDCALMVPHRPAIRGHAELRDWLNSFFTSWSLEVESVSFEGVAIGDRVAFARYTVLGKYVPTDGDGVSFDQKYLDTLVREPGGPWRFAAHMVNSNAEGSGFWSS